MESVTRRKAAAAHRETGSEAGWLNIFHCFFNAANQDMGLDFERPAEPEEHFKGRRLLVVFQHADVGRMQVGLERQRLLRQMGLKSGIPQFLSKHPRQAKPWRWVSP